MYLNQYWKDERLSFSPEEDKALTLSGDFAEQIWVPDTCFANDKNRWEETHHSIINKFLDIMHHSVLDATFSLYWPVFDNVVKGMKLASWHLKCALIRSNKHYTKICFWICVFWVIFTSNQFQIGRGLECPLQIIHKRKSHLPSEKDNISVLSNALT